MVSLKKGKNPTYSESREKYCESPAVGLPKLRTHSLLICSYTTVRHEGLQTVCPGRGRTLVTCGQSKGQGWRELHLYPRPRLRASCAPTEVPERAPTEAGTQNKEGQLGEEPHNSLFQDRILVCPLVKFLFSARFCFCFKGKPKRR